MQDPQRVSNFADYLRQIREAISESQPEKLACERHPAWKPQRQIHGQPLPPASMCPYCLREAEQKDTGPTVYIGNGPRTDPTQREEALLKRYLQRQEDAGATLPGSRAEEAALDRIADLRDEERLREAAKSGRRGTPAFQRIEDGQLVQYVNASRSIRKAPRLVRVAP
jgi:hypothetical protein